MKKQIIKKIVLLNQTTQNSLAKNDDYKIIENFTETGIKILEADFGYAWWKTRGEALHKLVYKSKNTPYEPQLPRPHGDNIKAAKIKKPIFIEHVKKENYEKEHDIYKYMKSYVVIPINNGNNIYGTLVICFKKNHSFSQEDRGLAVSLGNATAQAITISRLLIDREKMRLAKILLKEDKLKSEFITNATHEIRTPLAIIKGNVDLAFMENPKDINSYKKTLKNIEREVDHLSEMTSNLALLVSEQSEFKKQISLNSKKVNLIEILHKATGRCAPIAGKKNIAIHFHKVQQNIFLKGDEFYLERLFINLIKNAITYGRKGGSIYVNLEEEEDFIKIKIKDNGIGIKKEDLPYVFDRFYKANKAPREHERHTGLGLSIVKWTAQIHNGDVKVESIKGEGSTFTVSLPILDKESI